MGGSAPLAPGLLRACAVAIDGNNNIPLDHQEWQRAAAKGKKIKEDAVQHKKLHKISSFLGTRNPEGRKKEKEIGITYLLPYGHEVLFTVNSIGIKIHVSGSQ